MTSYQGMGANLPGVFSMFDVQAVGIAGQSLAEGGVTGGGDDIGMSPAEYAAMISRNTAVMER